MMENDKGIQKHSDYMWLSVPTLMVYQPSLEHAN